MRYRCKETFIVQGCNAEGKEIDCEIEIKINTVWELIEGKNITEYPIRLERANKKPSWLEINMEALGRYFKPINDEK